MVWRGNDLIRLIPPPTSSDVEQEVFATRIDRSGSLEKSEDFQLGTWDRRYTFLWAAGVSEPDQSWRVETEDGRRLLVSRVFTEPGHGDLMSLEGDILTGS